MCTKLVLFTKDYTRMHGQQNIKRWKYPSKCNSFTTKYFNCNSHVIIQKFSLRLYLFITHCHVCGLSYVLLLLWHVSAKNNSHPQCDRRRKREFITKTLSKLLKIQWFIPSKHKKAHNYQQPSMLHVYAFSIPSSD